MASPVDIYFKSIKQKFDFYANWLPHAPRALGDVGVLDGLRFERLTSLKRFNVTFATVQGGIMPDLSHSSGTNVSVQLKAAGKTLPNVALPVDKAGASISLSGEGAFLFQAGGPQVARIDDLVTLGKTLATMLKKGAWQEDWAVITEAITTNSLTVVMASSSKATLELEANGKLGPAGIPLASANAGLTVSTSSGSITKVLAAADAVPLFKLYKLKKSIIDIILGRGPHFGKAAGALPSTETADDWLEGVDVE